MKDEKPFWRSLAEYQDPPGPGETPEFDAPLDPPTSLERRRFLKLTGASVALASASACRFKEDKLLPMTQQPEGVVPGVARYFMTAMDLRGAGVGLKVKSFDGRPIKIDGNPAHPDSLGATTAQHQASLLELYDPDRSRGFAKSVGGALVDSTETDLRVFTLDHFRALRVARGRGLAVLTGVSSSPTLADMKARWQERFPEAAWYEYEPAASDGERLGSLLAFGGAYRSQLALGRATIIVSLDADLFGARTDGLACSRAWAARRNPASGEMNRVYAFESSLSETGSAADHRFAIRAEHVKALAAYLDSELSRQISGASLPGVAQPKPSARFLDEPALQKILVAAVSDLLAHRGESLVVVGAAQPPEVHALGHRLNALLGNVGKTLTYTQEPRASGPGPVESLATLTQEMAAGKVSTLLVLDSNPVYTAPADIDFAAALAQVKAKLHVGLYRDETATKCDWHVPLAHYLESWGDVRGSNGVVSIQQPVIAPLYGGKSLPEVLAMLTADELGTGLELVQRGLGDLVRDPRLWRKAVHDGLVPNSAWGAVSPVLRPIEAFSFVPGELSGLNVEVDQLELVLAPDPRIYDGRFANNGWLQELPDTATKLTWDNALLMSPKTAEALGITDSVLTTLSIDGRSIEVPALLSPGQATGSLKLYLGYGRTAAGNVAGILGPDPVDPIGVNAYRLRSKRVWGFARGASVKLSGGRYKLATTQDKHTMDRIGKFGTADRLPMLVRQATLHEYREEPDFAKHKVHHPPLLSLWKEPVSYSSPKWAMSIDLNKCTGCSGCVVACQAENNIPVVGKERVAMGREMQWLRIDRYFGGDDPEQPEALHQPIPCMHCEHA
ncbi:MAG TPA: molybdopterin oxidoreductase, partial [Polyangiaceae bacterium]|nr:molybdopterin oxidoreductase [Polyangiaceae bacterium]